MQLVFTIFGVLCISASALYSSNDDVVELTSGNFKKQVLDSDSVWIVEFYAPWCDHCKSLTPEYKKAATALKGIAKVGAVDMTQHQSVGGPYNVQGFPTIKIFAGDKNKPTDFNGARTAETLVNTVRTIIENLFDSRLNGEKSGSGSSSSSGGGKRGSGNDVVELTDSNFEEMVLKSKDLWLLIFYGCSSFTEAENEWEAAASDLKGKVRLGAVDATVHTVIAGKFNIRGFPTIKFFGAGEKTINDAMEYDGGRTTSDIVTWANAKAAENLPPPELNGHEKQFPALSFVHDANINVVNLTDRDFETVVLQSKTPWLVYFYAPWCNHCKRLEPHWNNVVLKMKGELQFGALDGSANAETLKILNITVAPTIKFFHPDNAGTIDYDGGFTTEELVSWTSSVVDKKCPFYKIREIRSQKLYDKICDEKEFCIISFFPPLSECSKKCRQHIVTSLLYFSDLFSYNNWGWLWTEIGKQHHLERFFNIDQKKDFSLIAINHSQKYFRALEGPLTTRTFYGFLLGLHFKKVNNTIDQVDYMTNTLEGN